MSDRIPLFPLNSVLYPGVALPLHVFEPRYRLLVATLLDQPADYPREFGVVAIRAGYEMGADALRAVYDVGCTALIRQVTAHPDGRYDILATGHRRFRIRSVDRSRPYLTGDIDWLPEQVGDGVDELLPRVAARFRRYRELLGAPEPEDSRLLPEDPTALSYLVSAAMILDLSDKQRLLEAADTSERLHRALALLRREEVLIGELQAIPAVDLIRERAPGT